MEWILSTLKEIWNWIQSLEGVSTISFGSIITLILNFILKNRASLKMNAKYNALSKEYKEYAELVQSEKELYTAQLKQYHVIIDDLYDLALGMKENAKAQSEAMNEAFKNSNLNASAKRLIEELLKTGAETSLGELEITKPDQLPISSSNSEVEEVINNGNVSEGKSDEQQIFRVK